MSDDDSSESDETRATAIVAKRMKRIDAFKRQLDEQGIPIDDATVAKLLAAAERGRALKVRAISERRGGR